MTEIVDKYRLETEGFDKAKSQAEKFEKAGTSAFKNVGAQVVVAQAAFGAAQQAARLLVNEIKKGFQANIDYQRTVDELRRALKNTGHEVDQNTIALNAQSAALEQIAGISDETIRKTQALALNFGVSADKVDDYIRAAIRMSKVTGQDLNTALGALVKVEQGVIDRTLKIIPGLSSLTKEQLKNGDAVALVNSAWSENLKLSGTLDGQIQGLTTSWDSFTEALTKSAAESTAFKGALGGIKSELDRLTNTFNNEGWQRGMAALIFGSTESADIVDFLFPALGFGAVSGGAGAGAITGSGGGQSGNTFTLTETKRKKGGRGIGGESGRSHADIVEEAIGGLADQHAAWAKYESDLADERLRIQESNAQQRIEVERRYFDAKKQMEEDSIAYSAGLHERESSYLESQNELRINSVVQSAEQITGMLSSITASAAKENKAMFDAHKAFAIADALISGATGVARTLGSYPMPWALIPAAAHAAIAGAQVAAIASQQFTGGSSGGGSVMAPVSYNVQGGPGMFGGGAAGAGRQAAPRTTYGGSEGGPYSAANRETTIVVIGEPSARMGVFLEEALNKARSRGI